MEVWVRYLVWCGGEFGGGGLGDGLVKCCVLRMRCVSGKWLYCDLADYEFRLWCDNVSVKEQNATCAQVTACNSDVFVFLVRETGVVRGVGSVVCCTGGDGEVERREEGRCQQVAIVHMAPRPPRSRESRLRQFLKRSPPPPLLLQPTLGTLRSPQDGLHASHNQKNGSGASCCPCCVVGGFGKLRDGGHSITIAEAPAPDIHGRDECHHVNRPMYS